MEHGSWVTTKYEVNLLEISRYDICAGNVLKTVSFNFSSNLLFDKSNTVNFFIGAKNLAGICWMAFSVKFNTCNLTIFTKSCFFNSASLFLARLRWCIFSVMLLWISTVVKYPTLEGKISYFLEEAFVIKQSSNSHQALRAYCPNIYTGTQPVQTQFFHIFTYLWGISHWSFRNYGSNLAIFF